jgi:hypothetical protein
MKPSPELCPRNARRRSCALAWRGHCATAPWVCLWPGWATVRPYSVSGSGSGQLGQGRLRGSGTAPPPVKIRPFESAYPMWCKSAGWMTGASWNAPARALPKTEMSQFMLPWSLSRRVLKGTSSALRMPKRQTHVTVVCGSQSERIAGDFRAAGLQHVRVFAGGYFEDWVKAAVNESLRP